MFCISPWLFHVPAFIVECNETFIEKNPTKPLFSIFCTALYPHILSHTKPGCFGVNFHKFWTLKVASNISEIL